MAGVTDTPVWHSKTSPTKMHQIWVQHLRIHPQIAKPLKASPKALPEQQSPKKQSIKQTVQQDELTKNKPVPPSQALSAAAPSPLSIQDTPLQDTPLQDTTSPSTQISLRKSKYLDESTLFSRIQVPYLLGTRSTKEAKERAAFAVAILNKSTVISPTKTSEQVWDVAYKSSNQNQNLKRKTKSKAKIYRLRRRPTILQQRSLRLTLP